jgi:hypothetical protein
LLWTLEQGLGSGWTPENRTPAQGSTHWKNSRPPKLLRN